jgi:hypothetical protein
MNELLFVKAFTIVIVINKAIFGKNYDLTGFPFFYSASVIFNCWSRGSQTVSCGTITCCAEISLPNTINKQNFRSFTLKTATITKVAYIRC